MSAPESFARRTVLAVAAVAICLTRPAWSQPAPPEHAAPAAEMTQAEQIEAKRRDLGAELADARRRLEQAEQTPGGSPPPDLVREVDLLSRIDVLLSQQASVLQGEAALLAARDELIARLAQVNATGPQDPAPPYTFLTIEDLRDRLDAEMQRGTRVEAGVRVARDALELARRELDERERARRQVRETADANQDPALAGPLAAQLRLAVLESRMAAETVPLRALELAIETLNQQIYELTLQVIRAKIAWIEREVTLGREDLRQIEIKLAAREQSLRDSLERADRNARFTETQLFDARRKLDAEGGESPALTEEVEARRLAHGAARHAAISLGRRLEWLAATRTAWQRRFALSAGLEDTAELATWEQETDGWLERLEIARELVAADIAGARRDLAALAERLDAGPDGEIGRWLREQKTQLEGLEAIYEADLTALESARRIHARLKEEIRSETARISLGERLGGVWRSITSAWRYEVTSIDDRPITVGRIAVGLLLLIVGLFLSRLLSGLFGRRLLRRVGMQRGPAAAIQSVTFYVLLLLFALVALRLAHVPLTAFTILGGALAIGAGFGSQTIIKNFLSGLVLLAERPIRVGDLIQVGDLYGIVELVGARSTRVRTGDNIEIVVPNGAFLEQNVINWTLSETRVRVSVAVGVVYGSPTREVTRLLQKAVEEHGRVLSSPAPIVLFTEFGDNSLNFEVHFWIHMRSIMDRRIIESDVRYRVDHLFREAGITIAFPQRDVHLDSARPVDVRLLPSAGDGRPAPE